MYWTSLGTKPAVFVSHMDGGKTEELSHVVVGFPTDIAVDYQHYGRYVWLLYSNFFRMREIELYNMINLIFIFFKDSKK